jgi:hypothetical protein
MKKLIILTLLLSKSVMGAYWPQTEIKTGIGPTAVSESNPFACRLSDGTGWLSALDVNASQSGVWSINDISGTISLPTGAATAANQSTANSYLSSIDTKIPALVSGRVPVDGSGVTQPISAVSLPLPTGAATAANQSTANSYLSSIDTKIPALVSGRVPVDGSGVTQPISAVSLPLPTGAATEATLSSINGKLNSLGQKTMANSMPVTMASDQTAVRAGVSITDNYAPNSPYTETSLGTLKADPDGQLLVRGSVLTDEGTFRDDFIGSVLDSSIWTSAVVTTGTINVANSIATLATGNSASGAAYIFSDGDYGPISLRTQLSISQRLNNQTTEVGFRDTVVTPTKFAFFRFTGTSVNQVTCVTGSSSAAADTQTTTVTLNDFSSTSSNDYYIEVQPDQVSFIINNKVVATHRLHVPGPYDVLNIHSGITTNSGPGSNTSLAIDYIYFINQNSIQVNNSFAGDPLPIYRVNTNPATYSATSEFVMANTPTDVFTITGSASKTVTIRKIIITGTQTTATNRSVFILKRSTANTGGTSTTLTAVPHDNQNVAATAVVRSYTANPTLGTLVGNMYSEKLFIPTTTTIGNKSTIEIVNSDDIQDFTLRGINEVLSVNFNSVTSAGNSMNMTIVWSEK